MIETIKIRGEKEANPKQDIIDALNILKDSPGWKIAVKALQTRIDMIDLKLHGEIELGKGEITEVLQREWSNLRSLQKLPEELIGECQENKGGFSKKFDPYDD